MHKGPRFGAFSAADAAAMFIATIRQTWTTARPEHPQHLKSDPVFRALGCGRTIQAIDEGTGRPTLAETA